MGGRVAVLAPASFRPPVARILVAGEETPSLSAPTPGFPNMARGPSVPRAGGPSRGSFGLGGTAVDSAADQMWKSRPMGSR
jgi:hypothetical protein